MTAGPYRQACAPSIPAPRVCAHEWHVRTHYYYFGDPDVVVECSKCWTGRNGPLAVLMVAREFGLTSLAAALAVAALAWWVAS